MLTIEDPDGATREVQARGIVAYKPPVDSLAASEWNGWSETPDLAADERVRSLVATNARADTEHSFQVLYSERSSGPLYGSSGSDTTRYQLALIGQQSIGAGDLSSAVFFGADFA